VLSIYATVMFCLTSPEHNSRQIRNLRECHCLGLGNLEAKNGLIIKILYETDIKYSDILNKIH
jgi:hypothetical protein